MNFDRAIGARFMSPFVSKGGVASLKNRAAVLYAPHDVRLEDRSMPEMGPGDVLVEIKAVGVCGSDVHYYEHGRIGSYIVRQPLILGHESAGVIVAVGAEVS